MSQIATREHKQAANKLKNVLATYNEAEDRSMYSYVRLSIDRCTATYV